MGNRTWFHQTLSIHGFCFLPISEDVGLDEGISFVESKRLHRIELKLKGLVTLRSTRREWTKTTYFHPPCSSTVESLATPTTSETCPFECSLNPQEDSVTEGLHCRTWYRFTRHYRNVAHWGFIARILLSWHLSWRVQDWAVTKELCRRWRGCSSLQEMF